MATTQAVDNRIYAAPALPYRADLRRHSRHTSPYVHWSATQALPGGSDRCSKPKHLPCSQPPFSRPRLSYLDLQHLVHRGRAERQAPEAVHRRGQVALERSLDADVFLGGGGRTGNNTARAAHTKHASGASRVLVTNDTGRIGPWRQQDHPESRQPGPAWLGSWKVPVLTVPV